MAAFLPGTEATRTLDLAAGNKYLFLCFIPDVDGTPHFAKGMHVRASTLDTCSQPDATRTERVAVRSVCSIMAA